MTSQKSTNHTLYTGWARFVTAGRVGQIVADSAATERFPTASASVAEWRSPADYAAGQPVVALQLRLQINVVTTTDTRVAPEVAPYKLVMLLPKADNCEGDADAKSCCICYK